MLHFDIRAFQHNMFRGTGITLVFANLAAHVRASGGLACPRSQWRPFVTMRAPFRCLASASSTFDLDYSAFKERLENTDIYLIDVRETYEYERGTIRNAINIPCMVIDN
jgi:hypothetical protein